MAKYRKKQNLSDSLELLLDTMCNTFGGIMFIAISLVVLSAFIAGGKIEDRGVVDSVAAMQVKTKRNDQKIKAIQNQIEIMDTITQGMKNSPAKELVQNVSELEKVTFNQQATIETASKKIDELNKRIKFLKASNSKKESDISKSQLERSKLNFELSKLKQKTIDLKKKATSNVRKLSFNTIKTTSKTPSWVILSGNTLYQINHGNEIETELVLGGGVRYTPKAGHGLIIGKEVNAKLQTLILSIKNSNQFMSLFVLPDSFAAMTTIKKYIQDQGLECNWYPALTFYECVLYPVNADTTFESE